MNVAGIIVEYNPLHSGHLLQLTRTRELLGPDTPVVCVMSGNYVQRGDFALVEKHARAEAAVRCGVDLVLELPLPWAVSSAETFADGGVAVLAATGVVTHLSFGSECGDAGALMRVARALTGPDFSDDLRRELRSGVSYAAARQRAAERRLPAEDAQLLSRPNNILGIEYGKSLLRRGSSMEPLSILRQGGDHDQDTWEENPSASALRTMLRTGESERALDLMPPAMEMIYRREAEAGRAPVFANTCERAILSHLRLLSQEDCLALDGGKEGLGNRFYDAIHRAATLTELLDAAKTKRYAYARLRRMVLWAWLGLTAADVPERIPYLRVLAAGRTGCDLLAQMRKTASVPVLTKPADVRRLSDEAQRLFSLEVRATDLYTLAYPDLRAAQGGREWRMGPVIV